MLAMQKLTMLYCPFCSLSETTNIVNAARRESGVARRGGIRGSASALRNLQLYKKGSGQDYSLLGMVTCSTEMHFVTQKKLKPLWVVEKRLLHFEAWADVPET